MKNPKASVRAHVDLKSRSGRRVSEVCGTRRPQKPAVPAPNWACATHTRE